MSGAKAEFLLGKTVQPKTEYRALIFTDFLVMCYMEETEFREEFFTLECTAAIRSSHLGCPIKLLVVVENLLKLCKYFVLKCRLLCVTKYQNIVTIN